MSDVQSSDTAPQTTEHIEPEQLTTEQKARQLFETVPSWIESKPITPGIGPSSVYIPTEDKLLILGYAFIGLVELVIRSDSKFTSEQVTKACIEKAMHNLRKDGLLPA